MPIEFKMPKLGESVTEGTIGRWLKRPGDTLEQYEPMLEVTTDKVDTEVSAPINGTLLEIIVPEGDTVAVGTIIARLADSSEAASTQAITNGGGATSGGAIADNPVSATTPRTPTTTFISPAVVRLAAEQNIDLTHVVGSGDGGRITKKDVERFAANRADVGAAGSLNASSATSSPAATTAQGLQNDAELPQTSTGRPSVDGEERAFEAVEQVKPQESIRQLPSPGTSEQLNVPSSRSAPLNPGADDEIVPLSPMRRAIAEHMMRSKRTAPHVTTVIEADLCRVTLHREKHNAEFERQGVKLTFTPYFVQAAVVALREVPIVNASFADNGILMHQRINIGVAVAIPDGLIVPVIKDADDKSLLGLCRAVNDLAERARTRRLHPDDTQEGTFTITNHGVTGSLFAMPIINHPQAAILGVGAIQKRPIVITENGLDALAIRPMCYLSLTFDHRLIDGATADCFLAVVKRTLEEYG